MAVYKPAVIKAVKGLADKIYSLSPRQETGIFGPNISASAMTELRMKTAELVNVVQSDAPITVSSQALNNLEMAVKSAQLQNAIGRGEYEALISVVAETRLLIEKQPNQK